MKTDPKLYQINKSTVIGVKHPSRIIIIPSVLFIPFSLYGFTICDINTKNSSYKQLSIITCNWLL